MFDYFKKHKHITDDDDLEQHGKPKKDKVFIVILILLAAFFVIGFVTGNGGTADGFEVENNFKFGFNISDGIMVGGLIVGYVIMHIRKGRK